MEIYEYAKSINYGADYYDIHTGYTYLIQNYGIALKLGLPTKGIGVLNESGHLIGYAKKPEK